MTTANAPSDDPVSFDHRHIDLENRDDVSVIGNVHGCLDAILETLLTDDQNRWVMRSDGTDDRCGSAGGSSTDGHETFMRSAATEARRDPRT